MPVGKQLRRKVAAGKKPARVPGTAVVDALDSIMDAPQANLKGGEQAKATDVELPADNDPNSFEALQAALATVRKDKAELAKESKKIRDKEHRDDLKFRKSLLADQEVGIHRDMRAFHQNHMAGMGMAKACVIIIENFTGIGVARQEGEII